MVTTLSKNMKKATDETCPKISSVIPVDSSISYVCKILRIKNKMGYGPRKKNGQWICET